MKVTGTSNSGSGFPPSCLNPGAWRGGGIMCIKLISKGSDHILWVLKWSNFTKRNVCSQASISGMVSVLTTWPQTNGMRPRKHSRLTALSHISVVSKKFHFRLILFCHYSHIQHLNSNRLSLTCRLSAVIAVFKGANKHVKNSKASCNQGDQGDQGDPGECCDQHDKGDISIPLIDSAW